MFVKSMEQINSNYSTLQKIQPQLLQPPRGTKTLPLVLSSLPILRFGGRGGPKPGL